jgi:hypothetical protein
MRPTAQARRPSPMLPHLRMRRSTVRKSPVRQRRAHPANGMRFRMTNVVDACFRSRLVARRRSGTSARVGATGFATSFARATRTARIPASRSVESSGSTGAKRNAAPRRNPSACAPTRIPATPARTSCRRQPGRFHGSLGDEPNAYAPKSCLDTFRASQSFMHFLKIWG